MKRVIAYVDGYNLYYGLLKGTPYKWLDLVSFVKWFLRSDQEIVGEIRTRRAYLIGNAFFKCPLDFAGRWYNTKSVAKQFQKGVDGMSCLTVRDLPPQTLYSLKTRAKSNHRSLNGEILFIFEWVTNHGTKTPPPVEGMMDPVVARQKSELDSLIGTWGDNRTAGEIIDDIYSARTPGREVAL